MRVLPFPCIWERGTDGRGRVQAPRKRKAASGDDLDPSASNAVCARPPPQTYSHPPIIAQGSVSAFGGGPQSPLPPPSGSVESSTPSANGAGSPSERPATLVRQTFMEVMLPPQDHLEEACEVYFKCVGVGCQACTCTKRANLSVLTIKSVSLNLCVSASFTPSSPLTVSLSRLPAQGDVPPAAPCGAREHLPLPPRCHFGGSRWGDTQDYQVLGQLGGRNESLCPLGEVNEWGGDRTELGANPGGLFSSTSLKKTYADHCGSSGLVFARFGGLERRRWDSVSSEFAGLADAKYEADSSSR